MRLKQVVLVGAGNVAWQIGRRFYEQGIPIAQVYSRQFKNARTLADALHCPAATDDLKAILPLDDCLYLLMIKDDVIGEVAAQLSFLDGPGRLLVHTSGAIASTEIKEHFSRSGVFYPLQSLSRERAIDFAEIPICVYASDKAINKMLSDLAARISDKVFQIDDEQRKVLHVAAVFVNNFSNHLFAIGKEILEQEDLPFDLLRPLITETAAKIMDHDPAGMQTGPAVRNDRQTILTHLQYLQQYPEFQNLYRMISHSIGEMYM